MAEPTGPMDKESAEIQVVKMILKSNFHINFKELLDINLDSNVNMCTFYSYKRSTWGEELFFEWIIKTYS